MVRWVVEASCIDRVWYGSPHMSEECVVAWKPNGNVGLQPPIMARELSRVVRWRANIGLYVTQGCMYLGDRWARSDSTG